MPTSRMEWMSSKPPVSLSLRIPRHQGPEGSTLSQDSTTFDDLNMIDPQ